MSVHAADGLDERSFASLTRQSVLFLRNPVGKGFEFPGKERALKAHELNNIFMRQTLSSGCLYIFSKATLPLANVPVRPLSNFTSRTSRPAKFRFPVTVPSP